MVKGNANLQKIILDFKDALSGNIEVDALILFGSYATGHPTRYSDIDVAVVSPDFSRTDPIKNLQFLFKVAKKIDVNLEPLAFLPDEIKNPDPRSFESEIVKTGKIMWKK